MYEIKKAMYYLNSKYTNIRGEKERKNVEADKTTADILWEPSLDNRRV